MSRCPKCNRFSLQYDPQRQEWRCGWRACGHSEGRMEHHHRLQRCVSYGRMWYGAHHWRFHVQ